LAATLPIPFAASPGNSLERQIEDEYRIAVRSKLLSNKHLDFLDTLELEYLRVVKLGLNSQQRDRILLELDQPIAHFNPARFVYPHDEKTEISLRRANL